MSELDITIGALRELAPWMLSYAITMVGVTKGLIKLMTTLGDCNEH